MVNVPEIVSGIVTDDSIPFNGCEKTIVPSSVSNSMMPILCLSHFAMSLADIVYYSPAVNLRYILRQRILRQYYSPLRYIRTDD